MLHAHPVVPGPVSLWHVDGALPFHAPSTPVYDAVAGAEHDGPIGLPDDPGALSVGSVRAAQTGGQDR
jgi:hypothetical protein